LFHVTATALEITSYMDEDNRQANPFKKEVERT